MRREKSSYRVNNAALSFRLLREKKQALDRAALFYEKLDGGFQSPGEKKKKKRKLHNHNEER